MGVRKSNNTLMDAKSMAGLKQLQAIARPGN